MKSRGPYSFEQLRKNKKITPDTLVWKEGFMDWIPIRNVPELRHLFKDEDSDTSETNEEENQDNVDKKEGGELVLEMQEAPPPFFFWFILTLLALLLILMQSVSRQ